MFRFSATEIRLGQLMLLVAFGLCLWAGLRNLDGPWDRGLRGQCGARFADGAIVNTLEYGWSVTRGLPGTIVMVDGQPVADLYWHHPPLYWIFTTALADLFGHHRWLLRLAALLLFLPGLPALYSLVTNTSRPLIGGVAVLLFAALPIVAYFGPMVQFDGAALSLGILTMEMFRRHLDSPSRRTWWATAALFFGLCLLDYPCYLWGLSMFVLALGAAPDRRPVRSVLSFLPVSLAALAMTIAYLAPCAGGLHEWLHGMSAIAESERNGLATTSVFARSIHAAHELFVVHRAGPIFALALAGAIATLPGPRTHRRLLRLGVALLLPGLLSCALFYHHALDHAYWILPGAAGIAVLAAALAQRALAQRGLAQRGLAQRGLAQRGPALGKVGRGSRVLAVVLLGTLGVAIVDGVAGTHAVISRFGHKEGHRDAFADIEHLFVDCPGVLTNVPTITTRVWYGPAQVLAVPDKPSLDRLLHHVRLRGYCGPMVYVLHTDAPPPEALVEHLHELAEPIVIAPYHVFRFML